MKSYTVQFWNASHTQLLTATWVDTIVFGPDVLAIIVYPDGSVHRVAICDITVKI